MTFYPVDDDDDMLKPKSESAISVHQSSFKNSTFEDEVPLISRDNSIKTEIRKEEMGTRGSESRLSDLRRDKEGIRRDKEDRRVIDRWNKHKTEASNTQLSKPVRAWVR